MKTIGLIGGMSWESTLEYYRIINRRVAERRGGLHSARCVLYSFDFAEIEPLQAAGDWDRAAQRLIGAGQAVARAGADFLVLCTNTMHKLADAVQAAVELPLLHIADATAAQIKVRSLHRVGLLGTRYTMEESFYKGRLIEKHWLDVVVPPEEDRRCLHDVIYQELCRGLVRAESRDRVSAILERLVAAGCAGIILGCTEIGLLLRPEDSPVPLFDTTVIHAEAAADEALTDELRTG